MAPKARPPTEQPKKNVKTQKNTGKKHKEKKKKYEVKLKGWLKTPADWARFNAWVKINAQPRKIPDPPPMVRISKPLWKMKKRIEVLSKPVTKPDLNKNFRLDLSVSKAALKAKPSRRIKILAKFVPKYVDPGREFPIEVTQAALMYKATPRIDEISKPKDFRTEECKKIQEKFENAKAENVDDKKRLAIAKRALKCPGILTDEDIGILMTETGVYRSALDYEFTPWMRFLSLPAYKFLKDRKDEESQKLKEEYLEGLRKRGKQALIEKQNRIEAQKARAIEKKKQRAKEEKINEDEAEIDREGEEEMDEDDGGKNEEETPSTEAKKDEDGEIEVAEDEKKIKTDNVEEEEDDSEEARKKWEKRNSWRFKPPPWKDWDPLKIKESALKGPVSPRMDELAKPHVRVNKNRRKNPFEVKKSALTSPVPARMIELAKPSHPRDPVQKPPPRKKDKFNMPIFPRPRYGKRLGHVPPYKEAECKDKAADESEDKKTEEKKEKNQKTRKESIDPIAFEPTVDPYFYPKVAKRQLEARKDARRILEEEKELKKATKENMENKIDEE